MPTRVAAIIAPQASLNPSLPDYRAESFRQVVAARLQASAAQAVPEAATLRAMLLEQQTMHAALDDPQLRETAAQGLVRYLAQEQPGAAYAMPTEEARRHIGHVFANRQRDIRGFCALLRDPDFIAGCRAAPLQPPGPYRLPPAKEAEMLERYVQPNDPNGPEPTIHVSASLRGQRAMHQALAQLFNPAGYLLQPLTQAQLRATPSLPADHARYLASEWLNARAVRAQAVVDATTPGAPFHNAALQRAEEALAANQTGHRPVPEPVVRNAQQESRIDASHAIAGIAPS